MTEPDILLAERDQLFEQLRMSPSGLEWSRTYSNWMDQLIRDLCAEAVAAAPETPEFALIAAGGYGRQELCPYSDLDLTLVPAVEQGRGLDGLVRTLFRGFQNLGRTLKIQIGYNYHPLNDALGLDGKTRTSLLDARPLFGSARIVDELSSILKESWQVGEFLLDKINEREAAHAKTNQTPLVVEPNLKDGAGGLRCFHTANWIRLALNKPKLEPGPAYDYVLKTRNLLHLFAGREQDVLTRPKQVDLVDFLGQDLCETLSQIAQASLVLHELYQTEREAMIGSSFELTTGVHTQAGTVDVEQCQDGGTAAIGIAWGTKLGLSAKRAAHAPFSSIDTMQALNALSQGEAVVRNLDRAGILEQILPELTATRTLMPRDGSHTYTVYEHTLNLVGHLDRFESEPFFGSLRAALHDVAPLYLAALLHDVGKIDPERPHSEVGAEMAQEVCNRWNVSPETTEDVVWLIRHHLLMSKTIRLRDIYNPQTVEELVGQVGAIERLQMLTLLTAADIMAVSKEAWSLAQETFLRDLYELSQARLESPEFAGAAMGWTKGRLARLLQDDQVEPEQVQEFLDSLPAQYLASTPPEAFKVHYHLAQKARRGEFSVVIQDLPELGSTEITVCTPDAKGLLQNILGTLYAFDVAPLAIRVSTTEGETPVAIDVFVVTFRGHPVPNSTAAQIERALEKVLTGEKPVDDVLTQHGKKPDRKQEVLRTTYQAGNPGILEVRAPRGRGMAFRVARQLNKIGCNVVAARVGQWAGNAAASFYICNPDGTPVEPEQIAREFKIDSTRT